MVIYYFVALSDGVNR